MHRILMAMSSSPKYRDIWRVSYPIFLSLLAQNLIVVVDTAFLGRVGEVELGAAAIGGLFYVSLYIIGFGFGVGVQILVGRRNGEGRPDLIGSILDHAFYFMLVLAAVLLLFSRFFSASLLGNILQSKAVFEASKEYLDVRIWGLFFAFINITFRAFYIGIIRTRLLIFSALIMAVVNITFDYLLIFGHGGFPVMGIRGAALASVMAEFASAVFFTGMTLLTRKHRLYRLFRFLSPSLHQIGSILRVAVFMMLQVFLSVAGWFAFFLIIERTGERALAVSNIIRSLYMILTIPIWSLGAATNSLVSNTIGAGRSADVIPVIRMIAGISLLSMLAVITASLLFTNDILSLYSEDLGLIRDSRAPFHVILGVMVIFSVAIVLFNGVAGTANTHIALFIETLAIILYLFLAWILAVRFDQPVSIIWSSEYLYFTLLGVLSLAYLRRGKWKERRI